MPERQCFDPWLQLPTNADPGKQLLWLSDWVPTLHMGDLAWVPGSHSGPIPGWCSPLGSRMVEGSSLSVSFSQMWVYIVYVCVFKYIKMNNISGFPATGTSLRPCNCFLSLCPESGPHQPSCARARFYTWIGLDFLSCSLDSHQTAILTTRGLTERMGWPKGEGRVLVIIDLYRPRNTAFSAGEVCWTLGFIWKVIFSLKWLHPVHIPLGTL